MCRSDAFCVTLCTGLSLLAAGCQAGAKTPSPPKDMTSEPETVVVDSLFKDGALRIRESVICSDHGERVNHGRYTRWYPNATKECEMTFAHGVKHGTAIFWHRNGKKWTQDQYVHGVKQGPRFTWDDRGRKRAEEQYLDGKPHGTWTVWRSNGEIKTRSYFDHGKPVNQPPNAGTE